MMNIIFSIRAKAVHYGKVAHSGIATALKRHLLKNSNKDESI